MLNTVGSSFLYRQIYKARTIFTYHMILKKKFASIADPPVIWGAWNVEVFGPNISIGRNCVIVASDDSRVRLNSIEFGHIRGRIEIGNNVLLMNGIRVSSASKIVIGDDCMLANYCYLTDADWHDLHDRTMPVGSTKPIILEKGAWIGDSAIVCKGVRIGENSIVGAGSVVRRNVPPNVVVSGNPAKIVKKLNPDKIVTMSAYMKRIGRL